MCTYARMVFNCIRYMRDTIIYNTYKYVFPFYLQNIVYVYIAGQIMFTYRG